MFRYIKENYKYLILFVALVVAVGILLYEKADYHLDDLITYTLANSEGLQIEDGKVYTPADAPFIDALSSHGFDVANVWEQQAKDNHPPLHYLLVHIICSVFRGRFSRLYAGAVNALFILLTFHVYRKITVLLTDNETVRFFMALAFVMTAGILSITSFLRMYVMLMFFVTAITYLVMKGVDSFTKRDLFVVGITTLGGALTQYYFLVHIFFLSAVITLLMIFQKRYRELAGYVVAMAVAGALSLIIFPAMLGQMFSSGTGSQYAQRFSGQSDTLQVLGTFGHILDHDVFGDRIDLIVIVLAIFAFAIAVRAHGEKDKSAILKCPQTYKYLCIFIPAAGYFIVVARSAPYQVDRYIAPVYAVVLAGALGLVYLVISKTITPQKSAVAAFTVLLAVVIGSGLRDYEWPYLFKDSMDMLNYAAEYGPDTDAVIMYDRWWDILPGYLEIKRCKSAQFFAINSRQHAEELIENGRVNLGGERVALYITTDDAEDFAKEYTACFLNANPEYELTNSKPLSNGVGEALWFQHL